MPRACRAVFVFERTRCGSDRPSEKPHAFEKSRHEIVRKRSAKEKRERRCEENAEPTMQIEPVITETDAAVSAINTLWTLASTRPHFRREIDSRHAGTLSIFRQYLITPVQVLFLSESDLAKNEAVLKRMSDQELPSNDNAEKRCHRMQN